jgi:hypothetical protein
LLLMTRPSRPMTMSPKAPPARMISKVDCMLSISVSG